MRWLLSALLLLPAPAAVADTYVVPPDYQVVCLDLDTGAELWRVKPDPLARPLLFMFHGNLIAEGKGATHERYVIEPATGKVHEDVYRDLGTPLPVDVGRLEPFGNLRDSKGRELLFSPGNTRDLEVAVAGGKQRVRRLETFPRSLSVSGDLAIFTLSGVGSGGGEVYAWDMARGRLAWELDASRHLSKIGEDVYTAAFADGDRTYVSVDQVLMALETRSGKVLWTTRLPRQAIRRYDAPWTQLGKSGGKLLVSVYEDLFAVRPRDGKLLWHFDAGIFGVPVPVVHGGKVFVAARKGPAQQASASFVGSRGSAKSALKISRVGRDYGIIAMSRRSIPAGHKVWWSMSPPPKSRRPKVALRIQDIDGSFVIDLDLTRVLGRKNSTAYVKFTGYYRKATLTVDGKVARTATW